MRGSGDTHPNVHPNVRRSLEPGERRPDDQGARSSSRRSAVLPWRSACIGLLLVLAALSLVPVVALAAGAPGLLAYTFILIALCPLVVAVTAGADRVIEVTRGLASLVDHVNEPLRRPPR